MLLVACMFHQSSVLIETPVYSYSNSDRYMQGEGPRVQGPQHSLCLDTKIVKKIIKFFKTMCRGWDRAQPRQESHRLKTNHKSL